MLSVLLLFAMVLGVANGASATSTVSTTADTYVDSKASTVNFGSAPTAFVGRGFFVVVPFRDRALLEFTLPTLNSGSFLSSARLRIFIDSTSSNPFNLPITAARLTSPFVENTVTWNTQPGVFASPTTNANMTTLAGDWFEMDVTALVVAALQSADPTHLFVRLAASDETPNDDVNFSFRTKEFGVGDFAPQLILGTSTTAAPALSPAAMVALAVLLFSLGVATMRRGGLHSRRRQR